MYREDCQPMVGFAERKQENMQKSKTHVSYRLSSTISKRIHRQLSGIVSKTGKQYWSKKFFITFYKAGKTYRIPLRSNKEKSLKLGKKIWLFKERKGLQATLEKYHPRYQTKVLSSETDSSKTQTTIGDLFAYYSTFGATRYRNSRSPIDNMASLRRIVHRGLAHRKGIEVSSGPIDSKSIEAIEEMDISVLNYSMLEDYRSYCLEEVEDQTEIQKKLGSFRSTIKQAKSIFNRAACQYYEAKGIDLDPVRKFISYVTPSVKIQSYKLPPEKQVRSVFDLYNSLNKTDSNIKIALFLALYCGFRKNEILNARKSWISSESGSGIWVQSGASFTTKNTLDRFVPLSCVEMRTLEKLIEDREDMLIEPVKGKRIESFITDLNALLRSKVFPSIQKPTHECRKLYGSRIAKEHGIQEASLRLGHSSFEVTQTYYADLRMADHIPELWLECLKKELEQA